MYCKQFKFQEFQLRCTQFYRRASGSSSKQPRSNLTSAGSEAVGNDEVKNNSHVDDASKSNWIKLEQQQCKNQRANHDQAQGGIVMDDLGASALLPTKQNNQQINMPSTTSMASKSSRHNRKPLQLQFSIHEKSDGEDNESESVFLDNNPEGLASVVSDEEEDDEATTSPSLTFGVVDPRTLKTDYRYFRNRGNLSLRNFWEDIFRLKILYIWHTFLCAQYSVEITEIYSRNNEFLAKLS